MNLKNNMNGGFDFLNEEPVKYPKFSKGDKFINLFTKNRNYWISERRLL